MKREVSTQLFKEQGLRTINQIEYSEIVILEDDNSLHQGAKILT